MRRHGISDFVFRGLLFLGPVLQLFHNGTDRDGNCGGSECSPEIFHVSLHITALAVAGCRVPGAGCQGLVMSVIYAVLPKQFRAMAQKYLHSILNGRYVRPCDHRHARDI